MAFWTCRQTAPCAPHAHDYDEYVLVVEGYTLTIDGHRIARNAGQEYLIPRGGEVVAGTRTIHAFGGHRANRTPR